MAGVKMKHAHLRGAALSRSLLAVDEVHASDAYMNTVARRLVRYHLAIGGRAILMSATSGAAGQATWLDQDSPDQKTAAAAPFPAHWTWRAVAPLCPEIRAGEAHDSQAA